MALPTNRQEFKDACMRQLGWPVIAINLDDDQIDDNIDYALSYFADYHFDGSEKQYYKYIITEHDFPDAIHHVNIKNGGIDYSNTDTVTVTSQNDRGEGAVVNIVTDNNGTIVEATVANPGTKYGIAPILTITSSTGSGAVLEAELGGYVELPDNIIGVVDIFPFLNSITNISNLFSVQYQIALNEIWSLSGVSLVPYYTMFMHFNLIQQMLVGTQPIRYQRHKNRLYVDMAWARVKAGNFLIAECHKVIDPDEFRDVWKDRWLNRYATALIKKNWGSVLKKYAGVSMPGGVTFNGQQIYDEAVNEIAQYEAEMHDNYALNSLIYIG